MNDSISEDLVTDVMQILHIPLQATYWLQACYPPTVIAFMHLCVSVLFHILQMHSSSQSRLCYREKFQLGCSLSVWRTETSLLPLRRAGHDREHST